VTIYTGTGIDEDIDLHGSSPAFPTGPSSVTSASLTSQVAELGAWSRIVTGPLNIPASATEIAFEIHSGPCAGTAGSDDSFTIANVKMEIGGIQTPFRKPDYGDELRRSQRRYQKSFNQATVPAQAVGTTTGETRWRRFGSGTATEATQIRLAVPMRITPSITFYNPASANAQARDEGGSGDCASTASQNVCDNSFEVTCTGNGSGTAGGWIGVHWVADARL
jgi:hypothetical protein